MDEVRYSSVARTQAEIEAVMAVIPDVSTIYLKGRPRNRYDFTGISAG
jgi:hypothetical protein